MNTNPECCCLVSASGNADVFRELAAPLAAELESVLPFYKGRLPAAMDGKPVITNDATSMMVLGATLFVVGHLTKKVLDDVYTALVQPRLKRFLEKADAKLKGESSKKSFNSSIWYSEMNVLVSVTIKAESFSEASKQLPLARAVHEKALAQLCSMTASKPVQHYTIENGEVSAAPVLASHVRELRQRT